MKKTLMQRGFMLVLSSPSGAGKTTLSRALLKKDKHLKLSISATTREPRPGEKNGKDYFFITREVFQEKINQGIFLEYAEVFGHLYGTPKKAVIENLESGKDEIFDIDWQGTQQLAQKSSTELVSVFILPPSKTLLEKRLSSRVQDNDEEVSYRMSKATSEMSHWAEYDYIIINDDFNIALEKLNSILKAERLKRHRQVGLIDFVGNLSKK